MSRIKNRKGFTMAEMLITVAILVVLAALAFVGVTQYMKSMHQLEMDAIAKQIFISAQNHLSMADSQGFPGLDGKKNAFGHSAPAPAGVDNKQGMYYFIHGEGQDNPDSLDTAFGLMLPFGSVDETVRAGGTYIIRYQKSPAVVLDVFYAATSGRYSYSGFTGDDYAILFEDYTGDDNKENRRDYNDDGAVIGWYGGDDLKSGPALKAPLIKVINAESLKVEITDGNKGCLHQLILKGMTSGETLVLKYEPESTGTDTVILDDLCASSSHFYDLRNSSKKVSQSANPILLGENISVQAKVFSQDILTNVATSELRITNSLFDDATTVDSDKNASVVISNIRHLENLSGNISNCGVDSATVCVTEALQAENLVWSEFAAKATNNATTIYPISGNAHDGEMAGYFRAVKPVMALTYDGGYHYISGLKIFENGDNSKIAGVFSEYPSGTSEKNSEIKNLELIDLTVTGETDAGALAGKISSYTTVTNVLVRGNTTIKPAVAGGNAGGLIGTVNGAAEGKPAINKSASTAKIISEDGNKFVNAGGLIGSAEDAVIVSSYSGGHVLRVPQTGTIKEFRYADSDYDVTGGNAGGLIGSAKNTTVRWSYSTCSVSGTPAGGFIGSGTDMSIDQCYCTGRIDQTKASVGAFAGTLGGTASGQYYEIINEKEQDGSIGYLKAVDGKDYPASGTPTITALDADLQSYQNFVKNPSDWKPAKPANSDLDSFYNHRYSLETVQQLGSTSTTVLVTDYVFTHYGDWPAPELLVINVKPAQS